MSTAGNRDRRAKDQGWFLDGGSIFANAPKGWVEGEELEESRETASSSSFSPGGRRGFNGPRREGRRRVRAASRDIKRSTPKEERKPVSRVHATKAVSSMKPDTMMADTK